MSKIKYFYFSVGSNVDAVSNIQAAYEMLSSIFPSCKMAHLYETCASNSNQEILSNNIFVNTCFEIKTRIPLERIMAIIEDIEAKLGRIKCDDKLNNITIDIDLLLCSKEIILYKGKLFPDPDILKYDHLLTPLCDLCPNLKHPILKFPLMIFKSFTHVKNIIGRLS